MNYEAALHETIANAVILYDSGMSKQRIAERMGMHVKDVEDMLAHREFIR